MAKPNPWHDWLSPDMQRILSKALMNKRRYNYAQGKLQKWYNDWYKGKNFNRISVYPEYRWNTEFNSVERNSLLCVLAKMAKEGLWSHVDTVDWVGGTGNITFIPKKGAQFFHMHLLRHGYGDWWGANWKEEKWGVRSRFSGPQLHFLGLKVKPKDSPWLVEGHIDINNPGDPKQGPPSGALSETPGAIIHKIKDDKPFRRYTHQHQNLRSALSRQGISVQCTP